MRVGLVAVDSMIENLALMRLSAWHKALGDRVEWAFPLAADTYDRVYRSKQFDFTTDDCVPWPCDVVSGGTGYDLTTLLTREQDTIYPDYSLYPDMHYALGRLTRGCIRRCQWCIVWRQDGKVRQVADLDSFWRGQSHVRMLDDNIAAMPDLFVSTCNTFAEARVRVSWEALDIRLMDDAMCEALMRVRRWGMMHFAWDSMAEEKRTVDGLLRLKRHYPSMHDVLVYVLIGFDTTPDEDFYRVERLREIGVMPFVMPYDKSDPYQRKFARWVNRKHLFKSCTWQEFNREA